MSCPLFTQSAPSFLAGLQLLLGAGMGWKKPDGDGRQGWEKSPAMKLGDPCSSSGFALQPQLGFLHSVGSRFPHPHRKAGCFSEAAGRLGFKRRKPREQPSRREWSGRPHSGNPNRARGRGHTRGGWGLALAPAGARGGEGALPLPPAPPATTLRRIHS